MSIVFNDFTIDIKNIYAFQLNWSSSRVSSRNSKLESKSRFEMRTQFEKSIWNRNSTRLFDDCLTSRVESTWIVKQRNISHISRIYLVFYQESSIYLFDITSSRLEKLQHFQNSFFVLLHIVFIAYCIFHLIIKRLYRFNQSHYFVVLSCRNIRLY